jgi:hypothetical protein
LPARAVYQEVVLCAIDSDDVQHGVSRSRVIATQA